MVSKSWCWLEVDELFCSELLIGCLIDISDGLYGIWVGLVGLLIAKTTCSLQHSIYTTIVV